MSFTPARLPAVAPKSGAISASMRVSKNGVASVFLLVTRAAQSGGFEDLIGKSFDVQVGRGDHHGILRLEEKPNGPFRFARSIQGSARLRIAAWDLLPKEAHKAAACERAGMDGNAILIRLPAWAQPEARRFAVAAEHGLRR